MANTLCRALANKAVLSSILIVDTAWCCGYAAIPAWARLVGSVGHGFTSCSVWMVIGVRTHYIVT